MVIVGYLIEQKGACYDKLKMFSELFVAVKFEFQVGDCSKKMVQHMRIDVSAEPTDHTSCTAHDNGLLVGSIVSS